MELGFIRSILKYEKNIKRLKGKTIDRYSNEPIFKFMYDLMSSYRIF